MTDCYVCGHPILEGQRTSERYKNGSGPLEFKHLNVQDCLPTLGENDADMLMRHQERDRAARLVEKAVGLNLENIEVGDHIALEFTVGTIRELVEKIRSGDSE